MCARLFNCLELSSITPNVTRSCFLGWQGGGIFIDSMATATLTNSNVFLNEASNVCSLFEPSVAYHPSPH